MRQASKRIPESAEKTVRDIRRATRRHHSAEEKIRIVLEGLRGEDSIAELCRKEGINQNLYYPAIFAVSHVLLPENRILTLLAKWFGGQQDRPCEARRNLNSSFPL
jgi:hypothetical protein